MRKGLGVLLLGSLACAQVQVATEVDPETDFARFSSYAQVPPPAETPAAPRYSAALGEKIQQEIASQLDARGYRAAPEDQADLRVGFNVSGSSRTRLVVAPDPDATYQVEQPYVEGTLEIDVVDARNGRRVWRGRGTAEILTSGQLIRESVEDTALGAVRAILAKFPARREPR